MDERSIEFERIRRLLRRLRADYPVHTIAERLLSSDDRQLEDIQPLLAALENTSPSRWRERLIAAWALRHACLDPQQQAEASPQLCRLLSGRSQASQRSYAGILRTLIASALLSAVICWKIVSPGYFFGGGDAFWIRWVTFLLAYMVFTLFFAVHMSPLLIPLFTSMDARHETQVRVMAASSLQRLRDPLSVGMLAVVLYDNNPRVAHAARQAFQAALRTLSTDHIGQLPPGTIYCLCRVLTRDKEDQLVLEVLKALGKVGDGSALPTVEWVAHNRKPVAHMAERLIPVLQERRQRETTFMTLLRPTS